MESLRTVKTGRRRPAHQIGLSHDTVTARRYLVMISMLLADTGRLGQPVPPQTYGNPPDGGTNWTKLNQRTTSAGGLGRQSFGLEVLGNNFYLTGGDGPVVSRK